ncbi:MAG: S41 family peptidase [Candidatus Azobacteroides sp.]|nr:S41 family peptidase [Candidatus Azobacteroides sp.]
MKLKKCKEKGTKYFTKLILSFSVINLFSCLPSDDFDTTPQVNFDVLWQILDEHYCYFGYKNIDWDNIYQQYSPRISAGMSEEALFDVLGKMLAELKDGHVNLISPFNLARYWKWYEDYPDNFDEKIQRNYLEDDYLLASSIKYKVLDDNIGYMYYGSFSNTIGTGNLDRIITKFSVCRGIIIDVRNNSGGQLTNVEILASRFLNEKTLVGYSRYKTGKGHNDFSNPKEKYIEPADRIRFQKPVVVLTNRQCYSATNEFVNAMKQFPNVTIMGDMTGGGGGLPFSSEIPNGWGVRFSACPNYDPEMNDIEFGIEPDIYVNMEEEDMKKGMDTIIEEARNLISNQ